jgi:hypothetical protein
MPFWTWLIINIATFLLTELLRPKPQLEDAKPAGLGDFNVPTATEGRVVPIIWGRVKMAGPNVVWYGDLQADPITEKVKTGLFSSDTVTTGFRYSIGLQMALCRGPVNLLVNIRNDGSFCWGEDAPSADTPVVPIDAGAPYSINEPSFFGGEESGGGGGLVGGGRIFPGTETQAASAYLTTFQTPTPAYRGTCFVTWERGEIGLSPSLRPFEFELDRFPDGLDLATLQPGDEIIDLGANPMNVVFEVLTNDEWGLRRSSSEVDLVNFRAVAATMKAEGQGFAWLWDRSMDVLEVVKMIEQQVDGVLTQDPVTGLYTFKLIRFDYTPGTLPLLDESNVKSVKSFQRPAWAETQNQVVVEFTDRRKNYTTSFALAQDMGNQDIVKTVNASKIRSPGVKNPTLANAIAWREIRTLSTPVPTMKLVTDRSQYALVPGDVREFTWDRFGITRLPVRITRVDRGQILNNEITLDVAQDVFAFNAGSFSDPIDTGWTPVSSEAQPSLRERLWEVPFQLSLNNERHLGILCSRDGGLHISFDVFSDRPSPGGGATAFEGTELDFTPTALITAAISRDKGDVTPFVQDIEIDGINDVTIGELTTAGSATVNANAPTNVFLIDEELFFFESVLDLGGGLVRLVDCHAGLFDTVPADHIDNSVVWFIGFGVGLLQRQGALPTPPGPIDVKILPTTIRNTLDIGAAATLSTTVGNRIDHPIPPGDPMINGNRFHDLDGWTRAVGTLDFTWNTRNRVNQDFDTKQDDADLTQPGNVGGHVVVRRVDTAAAVVDFGPISSDQFITTGFIPQSSPGIPDELDFKAEISNQTVAGAEGQVVETREFEVFGFGLNFGGDFGGDANLPNTGVVLDQGDPPFTPEPVPGSGQDRIWTVDFLGSVNAGENRRYLVSFTDTLNQQTNLGFNFEIPESSFPTLEDMAEEFRAQCQAAIEFPPVTMPFTIAREGTKITITTRFGDFNLRMQNRGAAAGVQQTPGSMLPIQDAAPGSSPTKQVVYIDYFEAGATLQADDILSPTNDPAFEATGTGFAPNVLFLGWRAGDWEAAQEIGTGSPAAVNAAHIFVIPDGLSDSRSQDFQEFYDKIQESEAVEVLEEIEGPLAIRTGLDSPMSRTAIVLEVKENFEVPVQKVNTIPIGGGPAFDAGGFRLAIKHGTPAVFGRTAGLTEVKGTGAANDNNGGIGVIISMTLDGTVFSETLVAAPPPGGGSNVFVAINDLYDSIDADPRFRIHNRLTDPENFRIQAQIQRLTPNTPFEAFVDVGVGLRVEFRDISPQ